MTLELDFRSENPHISLICRQAIHLMRYCENLENRPFRAIAPDLHLNFLHAIDEQCVSSCVRNQVRLAKLLDDLRAEFYEAWCEDQGLDPEKVHFDIWSKVDRVMGKK